MLPYRVRKNSEAWWSQRLMERFADFVIDHNRRLLVAVGTATLVLVSFVPTLVFDDQWVQYFDERIEFRVDSDRAMEHFGLYPI